MSKIAIISPHCDDAMLSLGGYILHQNRNITIYTVFNITNYEISNSYKQDKSSLAMVKIISKLRQNEDRLVFNKLNCTIEYLHFEDACIRSGYINNSDYLSPKLMPRLDSNYTLIKNQLIKICTNYDLIFFPLGLGYHIDHRIVHEAGIDVMKLYSNKVIYFYEDVGYDMTKNNKNIISYIKTDKFKYLPKIYNFDNLNRKIDKLKLYKSQIDNSLLDLVRTTYKRRGGEIVWQIVSN